MQITFGDSIYSLDGEIYNSTFDFTDSTITINSLGSSVSLASAAVGDTFDVLINNQNVRAINDSVSAAFDSTIDYYALGDDSTLTAVTGTTKINDIELITNGHLTVTGKHYDLDDGSSYNLAQTITGLSGGDSITVNDLWSDATFAYYVSDDGTTISRISDDSIVYTGSADTLSSLNFGTISFMDYFTQTVGEVVDAFNTRYAAFDGTTLTIDAKTLKTNLDTQITAAQSELASAATITSTLVIDKMDDIIKSVISSDVGIKNLLNEDMYNAMSSQIDSILSAGGNPLDIFSTLDDYNGDIFSWICDSLVVPTAQILGTSTLERLAANLSNRLSSYGTSTIILNGSADTVSIGAYYGDSIDASSSTMENLIIAGGEVTDSPQKDLILLTGNNTHSGSVQNAIVLGKTDSAATVTGDLVEQGIYINGIHYDLGGSNTNQFITTIGGEDMTITAATLSGSSAFSSDDSGVISISAADGASVGLTLTLDGLASTVPVSANFTLSGGSLVYNPGSSNFSLSEGAAISFSRDDQVITLTTSEDISATCKVEEDIYYLTLDNEAKAKIAISNAGQNIFDGDLETGGVWSYRPETGTFGLTGANSSHGNGTNTFVQLTVNNTTLRAATNGTTIVFIPTYTDGIFKFNFPNEAKNAMLFTLSGNGETFFENNVSVDGTINLDIANQELSLTKDTEFKVNFGDDYTITIKATDDAGGKLTFTDDGVRFAPNTGDGELELNFDDTDRKASLNVDGAITFGADGKITLEDGTEVNLTWEDGSTLKLTSSGSTGSIAFGDKGLKITSDDEKLDLELTMAYGYSTEISGLKGSLWYNAGKVVLDEGTKLTGTGTLGANTVNVTLETIDGDAQLDFSTANGFVYGAGTGKLKVTYALGNRKSTFTVNEGSVLFGNNTSEIAEGTDLETDLQNFMPALNLTTTDAGTYTINGQTITTSAANIAMTATDNYISFVTNDDVVTHEGMSFAGDGTVSLSATGVILGAGVVATGFGEGESFILAEAGDVTADARIFELSNIEGTPREIPMIITVTGAQDGFTFSRTLTKESEAYLDDALDDEKFENYTSPYIGKIFTEQFVSAGDDSYRIRTDAIGLEEVIGISDGATITGGAILADEPTLSYYNLVTDTEGSFTIGEKTYNISGDSSVAIRARFEVDTAPYASYFDSLNGTVSGDFTGGQFSINQKTVGQIFADTNITISADDDGYKILGFDKGASLQASLTGAYIINGSTINAEIGDIITNINNKISIGGNTLSMEIDNTLKAAVLNGTDAADTISNFEASDVTINALGGDDQIINVDSGGVLINAGEGNNAVSNLLNYSTVTGASDFEGVSVIGGSGNDSIYNIGGNRASIVSGAGDDYISNRHGYYPTISAGDGNDFIRISNGHYQNIDAGAGNDTITADAEAFTEGDWAMGGYATLLGGEGNDLITPVYSNNSSINGGAGNDTIITNGKDATITGGDGNDYIELTNAETGEYEGAVIVASAGNDTIQTADSAATLKGDFTEVSIDGANVILTTSDGSLTVIDGARKTLNLNGTETLVGSETYPTLAATLAYYMLQKTEAGYPQMAALAFHPTEPNPDAPTNYYSSETWTTTSADDLQLSAVHYSPENPTGKWVILVHGYGKVGAAMNNFAESYLAQGVDVLIIDQRAAGNSAGEWLTMGVAESTDLAIWTQEIAKTNSNAQITLHGVSMGAATVMMAAALSQTTNVTGMIEDCGYGNIADVFTTLLNAYGSLFGFNGNVEALFEQVATSSEILTGYNVADAAPLDSIAQVTVPSLFIHGESDTAISPSNAEDLYNASGATNKTLLTIEGAEHARSAYVDSVTYLSAVTTLLEDSTEEIGAVISSSVDNTLIRGTIYDDTISSAGGNVTIQGGTGNDFISLMKAETGTSEGIVLALVEGENSTVEGFKGVSDGETDTLYFVDGVENKAVGFTSEGLSFWTDTVMGGSDYLAVTFPDISDTTLLNLVYGTEPAVVEAFVNDGDIYQASTGAADIYVGAVATHNQGVNFAGVGDATVTVDGLFGNGNINNAYTTIANLETLIGDNNMTFIIGGDTLTAADSVGTVTIKSSEDGTSTVAGTGAWNVNDSTVTLNSTSSLLSGESGLEVYTAGMIAYAAATLVSDPDNIIYSDAESLKGSGKNENIIVSNNRYLDISSGGEDTICLTNADTVTIKGYDVKTGSTFLTNTAENLTNLIMYGDPYLLTVGDGYFKADNLGKVVLEGTDTLNGTFVNFTVLNTNTTQLYGWSGQAGGNVDGSDYTQDAILIGVAPDGYSTLTGGAGNDTIYAAADDVVNLSSGNDLIDIDHLDREWRINGNIGGLTINLGSGNISANTTVKGFDNSVDKITVDDIGDLKLNQNDNNLQITVNDSTLTFEGITDTIMVTTSDDTYTVHVSDDNLTAGSAYYLETSDGILTTPDKGVTKKDNDYTYSTGTHTITGFNFGSTDDADELILNTEFNTVTADSSGNLNITKDDDDSLQLTNAENQVIKVNVAQVDWTVEIGNNLTYDEDVNYYGGKDTATLSIGTVSADSVAIWTNGWDGKIYNNVKDIDGSAYSGQASLAGNALDNVITASSGNTSLWGSAGNDTLIGSNGYDEFFYTKGDGDDVITNAESTDLINLLDIKLEDISEISLNNNSVVATFKEGGQLTVNGTSEVNAVLADGTKWLSDKANKGWILKA